MEWSLLRGIIKHLESNITRTIDYEDLVRLDELKNRIYARLTSSKWKPDEFEVYIDHLRNICLRSIGIYQQIKKVVTKPSKYTRKLLDSENEVDRNFIVLMHNFNSSIREVLKALINQIHILNSLKPAARLPRKKQEALQHEFENEKYLLYLNKDLADAIIAKYHSVEGYSEGLEKFCRSKPKFFESSMVRGMPNADYAILLGQGFYNHEGEKIPHTQFEPRTVATALLHKAGLIGKIIVTGYGGEAEFMRDVLIRKRVRRRDIILENEATDTTVNLLLSRFKVLDRAEHILDPKEGPLRIVTITSQFHINRAYELFRQIYGVSLRIGKIHLGAIGTTDMDIPNREFLMKNPLLLLHPNLAEDRYRQIEHLIGFSINLRRLNINNKKAVDIFIGPIINQDPSRAAIIIKLLEEIKEDQKSQGPV